MNRCLKHEQEYPQDGFCVYCGRPNPDAGVVAAPKPYQWPPSTGTGISVCSRCGMPVTGQHQCNMTISVSGTVSPPYPRAWQIGDPGSMGTPPKDAT